MLINASACGMCSCLFREKSPLLIPGMLKLAAFQRQRGFPVGGTSPCPSSLGNPGELLELWVLAALWGFSVGFHLWEEAPWPRSAQIPMGSPMRDLGIRNVGYGCSRWVMDLSRGL